MNQKSALQEDDLNHQAQLEFERIAIKEAVFIEYLIYPVCLFIILMTGVFLYHFNFFDKNSFSNIIANSFIFLVINFIFLNNHLREKMCFLDYSKNKREWFIRHNINKLNNENLKNILHEISLQYPVVDVPKNKIKCISWLFVLFNLELFFIYSFLERNGFDIKLIWKPDIFVNAINFVRNNICIQGSGFFCISIDLSDNFTSLQISETLNRGEYLLKIREKFMQSHLFESVSVFYTLRLFLHIPYLIIYISFFYTFLSGKWFNASQIQSSTDFYKFLIILPFMLISVFYQILFLKSIISYAEKQIYDVISWLFNPSLPMIFGTVGITYFINWFIFFKRLTKKYS